MPRMPVRGIQAPTQYCVTRNREEARAACFKR
jgi:hypothetical protein